MANDDSTNEQLNINVPVDTTGINDAFAKLIVQSNIGKAIENRLHEIFDGKERYRSTTLDDCIKRAVDDHVRTLIVKALDEHYDKIREAVSQKITSELVGTLVTKVLDKWNYS